ncbi:MAG: DUF362 domain-containing protein [Candidatus Latescibacteria bacterium]|nr:DUF362 domain-containing protein [Candidatus Latescibacterota bacterium]
MKRRNFLTRSGSAAAGLAASTTYEFFANNPVMAFPTSKGTGVEEANYYLESGKEKNIMPEVRPEILNNPRAVFLIETNVDARKDKTGHYTEAVDQLRSEGQRIARMLFVRGAKKGGTTFIKPNFTGVPEHKFNRTNGVYTSPDFVVGVIEHLREIGNGNVACGDNPIDAVNHRQGGVYDAFDPYGVLMIEAGYEQFEHYNKNELNWSDPVKSPVWNRIPYFKPILDDDNFLINIATLKCHLTALTTLTVKNLQGCAVRGFGQFCWPGIQLELQSETAGIDFNRGFQKNAIQNVEALFLKHKAAGFKRWEANTAQSGDYTKYNELGGYETYRKVKNDVDARRDFLKQVGSLFRQESWIHRGLDNAATLKPKLNIIEGIIGLDGNEHGWWNIGDDQLINIVIAGCSPFEVDAVGTYIMGHDPDEIWYTRVAKEKGLGECDINKIDIYWIRVNGNIEPVKNIDEIKRHPLGVNWARSDNPEERLFW